MQSSQICIHYISDFFEILISLDQSIGQTKLFYVYKARKHSYISVSYNFNRKALNKINVTPVLALHQCYRKQQGNPFSIWTKLSIAITLVRSATSERRHLMDQ